MGSIDDLDSSNAMPSVAEHADRVAKTNHVHCQSTLLGGNSVLSVLASRNLGALSATVCVCVHRVVAFFGKVP